MSYFHKFVKFSKAMFTVFPKKFALAPTNRRSLKKIGLVGTLLQIFTNPIPYQFNKSAIEA